MTKKRITHGYVAYKRGLCRCKVCTVANTAYEAKRRRERKLPLVVRLRGEHDTFTREELLAYREGARNG